METYERCDDPDQWNLNFNVTVQYETLEREEEIVQLHGNLIKCGSMVEQTSLLIKAERGKMYSGLKYSEIWRGKWLNLCKKLGVVAYTTNRYIDFFNLVKAYPRLLVCAIRFETIMSVYKQFMKFMASKDNIDLSSRLQLPLRHTIISCSMEIPSENLPHGGEAPAEQLSEGAEWNGGWEIEDMVLRNDETDDIDVENEEDDEKEDEENDPINDSFAAMDVNQKESPV